MCALAKNCALYDRAGCWRTSLFSSKLYTNVVQFPLKGLKKGNLFHLLEVGLVTLTSRFEATRGLFWDGPRQFGPRSNDEDDT
ncbi:hypothetical protein AVEN_35903-1 [Araneus ventricosus]|uniref:Uncharacterized protein n=1 Tax=Araneus ventricosus TaxID=182803 RepID=A0A4Y2TLT2_ARAVE|nr:hypothetical protein AVEN_35903-1 [Araneus ventricosus]